MMTQWDSGGKHTFAEPVAFAEGTNKPTSAKPFLWPAHKSLMVEFVPDGGRIHRCLRIRDKGGITKDLLVSIDLDPNREHPQLEAVGSIFDYPKCIYGGGMFLLTSLDGRWAWTNGIKIRDSLETRGSALKLGYEVGRLSDSVEPTEDDWKLVGLQNGIMTSADLDKLAEGRDQARPKEEIMAWWKNRGKTSTDDSEFKEAWEKIMIDYFMRLDACLRILNYERKLYKVIIEYKRYKSLGSYF